MIMARARRNNAPDKALKDSTTVQDSYAIKDDGTLECDRNVLRMRIVRSD